MDSKELTPIRFLVTGGAGFIGSNLVEYLLEQGYFVRVLDNFITGKRENIAPFFQNPNFELIEGDIRNYETCEKACANIDYVLHEAALGSVVRSVENPILSNEINVTGFLNMLQASYKANIKRFIYASSSSVYGDSKTLPKREGEEGNILSPYGITKKANELYAMLYTKLYGLKTIGLRYFNVYGKRQDKNSLYAAVIPIFINGILNEEDVYINGDGENSRDFTYVKDVVMANVNACFANDSSCGEVYNIGYGGRTTINELYQKIASYLKSSRKPIYREPRIGDVKHSDASIVKAKKSIGYDPKICIDEGIQETIKFYLEEGKRISTKN